MSDHRLPVIKPEARELLHQYLTMWKVFTEDHGNADDSQHAGLVLRWTNSAFPFWNMIFLDEENMSIELLQARLHAAADYMRGQPGRGFVNIFEEQLDENAQSLVPELAKRAGLVFGLNQHAMAGNILPVAEPSHPALRFQRVRTDEHLRALADLNSLGYGFTLDMGRAGLVGSKVWKSDHMHAWLGLENDKPVCCAGTIEG
jgi:hypothetical protein